MRRLGLALVLVLGGAAPLYAAEAWEKYIWETCRTTEIAPAAAPQVAELQAEVQKVLDAGPLAPQRTVYADLMEDPYFVYWQPGRIITTLAWAYPHLTPAQQAGVKRYVQAELADAERAPWAAKGHLPPDRGARRELHPFHEPLGWERYWGMWGQRKPALGTLYGLWLYGDRTGDWAALAPHYPRAAGFYVAKAGQGDLYGTMGAHVAMARLARRFGDSATLDLAVKNAQQAFESGRDFAGQDQRAAKYWKERYADRQRGLTHLGWMFLDLCPEVGRYLAENVKDDVLRRHQEGLARYPHFWLRETPYWSRWTGDEGLGIPTELMGMIVPVERWVAGAPPAALARYVRSAPLGVGDCYWIEALVHAIEATGKTAWTPLPRE